MYLTRQLRISRNLDIWCSSILYSHHHRSLTTSQITCVSHVHRIRSCCQTGKVSCTLSTSSRQLVLQASIIWTSCHRHCSICYTTDTRICSCPGRTQCACRSCYRHLITIRTAIYSSTVYRIGPCSAHHYTRTCRSITPHILGSPTCRQRHLSCPTTQWCVSTYRYSKSCTVCIITNTITIRIHTTCSSDQLFSQWTSITCTTSSYCMCVIFFTIYHIRSICCRYICYSQTSYRTPTSSS